MSRSLILLLCLSFPAMPQLLPERIAPEGIPPSTLASKSPAPIPDPGVWSELGLQDSATGAYDNPAGKYTLTAYRLQDPTSVLAAFDWQRPADSKPSKLAELAAETPTGMTVGAGNYLLIWNGHKPKPEELNAILLAVPRYKHGQLPTLPDHLPKAGLRPNSQHYIVGPATLAEFYPEISPSLAAFHLQAEAETAVFGKKGEIRLIIFSYPTFEVARKQEAEFAKLPGALARRSGPLVAITLNPGNADEAERILSRVRYQAEVTIPEKPPTPKDNPGNLLWNVALLILILIVFCAISGLVFGAARQMFRRFGPGDDGEEMVTLHISDRTKV